MTEGENTGLIDMLQTGILVLIAQGFYSRHVTGDLELLTEFAGQINMIIMMMGQQNAFDPQPVAADLVVQGSRFPRRVNQHCVAAQ